MASLGASAQARTLSSASGAPCAATPNRELRDRAPAPDLEKIDLRFGKEPRLLLRRKRPPVRSVPCPHGASSQSEGLSRRRLYPGPCRPPPRTPKVFRKLTPPTQNQRHLNRKRQALHAPRRPTLKLRDRASALDLANNDLRFSNESTLLLEENDHSTAPSPAPTGLRLIAKG